MTSYSSLCLRYRRHLVGKAMDYCAKLSGEVLSRYSNKIESVGLRKCPCDIPKSDWIDDMKIWPPVTYPDVYNYLIVTPGEFTMEALKAFKSLDAYNFVLSGWVMPLYVLNPKSSYRDNDLFTIIRGKVLPSQRVSVSPHNVWVAVQRDGVVVTGHCTCMAG